MRSWPGSRSSGSNGITSRPANRCRTALSKASTAVCATSVSTSTCSPISTRLVRSSRNGGSTTTPTDRTRASTGSHRPSLQPAPTGAKPRTDSPYKRGQIGEQVTPILLSCSANAANKPILAFVVNGKSDFWREAEAGVKKAQAELPAYDLKFIYPEIAAATVQQR